MMRLMNKLLFFSLALLVLTSCGRNTNSGDLVGVQDRPKWKGDINPYGMTYIPSGRFIMGPSDQDISYSYTARPRAISIQGFHMDEMEIPNNQYQQFVQWVRDSIAHESKGDVYDDRYGQGRLDWILDHDYADET